MKSFEERRISVTMRGDEWFALLVKLSGQPFTDKGQETYRRAALSLERQLGEESARKSDN